MTYFDQNLWNLNGLTTGEMLRVDTYLGKFPLQFKPEPSIKSEKVIKKTILYSNNTVYIGTINTQTFLREGVGYWYKPRFSKYYGEFKYNNMHGIGRLIFHDGSYYEGSFDNNTITGYGKYGIIDANNTAVYTYIGCFHKDLKQGIGEEFYDNGINFKGTFRKDFRCGYGILRYNNGKSLESYFYGNDTVNGLCRMKNMKNEISWGIYKGNAMNGVNIFTWGNGDIYVGEYRNNFKNGFGVFYWSKRKVCFEGFWINGKQYWYGIWRQTKEEKKMDLYLWRYGVEIDRVEEECDLYKEICHKLNNRKAKLMGYCFKELHVDISEWEQVRKQLENYKFKE